MQLDFCGNFVLDLKVVSSIFWEVVINKIDDKVVILERLRQLSLTKISLKENMLLAIHFHDDEFFIDLDSLKY